MAHGTELVLLLDRDIVRDHALRYLATADGMKEATEYPDGLELIENGYEAAAADGEAAEWDETAIGYMSVLVGDALRDVHLTLIKGRFDDDAELIKRGLWEVKANTPDGPRSFRPFTVESFGDEDGPKVLGISLWSRYQPTWLDWRHEHGGSGGLITFDGEANAMTEAARAFISGVIPEIIVAPLAIPFCHY